jgi:hypothetical protein
VGFARIRQDAGSNLAITVACPFPARDPRPGVTIGFARPVPTADSLMPPAPRP